MAPVEVKCGHMCDTTFSSTENELIFLLRYSHWNRYTGRYSYWLMLRLDSLEKTLMLGGIWGQEEKGTTEDEMARWHHWLDGRESEWTLGVGDGQGDLVCCDSWGRKESDTTERLNWTELTVIEPDISEALHIAHSQFSCSVVSDSETPQIAARQASLSITNSILPTVISYTNKNPVIKVMA